MSGDLPTHFPKHRAVPGLLGARRRDRGGLEHHGLAQGALGLEDLADLSGYYHLYH